MYKIRKKWPKWNDDDIAWLLRMMRSLFADMTSRGGCCSVCAQFVCGGISDVFFWREIWNVSKIYMSVGVYKNQHSPIRRYHIYIKVDEHERYNNDTSYLSDPRRSIWNWKSLYFGLPFAFKVSLRVRRISPHMTFVTCALSLLSLNGK